MATNRTTTRGTAKKAAPVKKATPVKKAAAPASKPATSSRAHVPVTGWLARGASGPAVAALRTALKAPVGDDDARDYYGDELARAVSDFQAAHELTVDGVAGPETLAVLHHTHPSTAPKEHS